MTTKNDFASMFEASGESRRKAPGARLEAGKQVEGTVLEVSGGLVIVDIGALADATLDLVEFHDRPVKVGDRIRATVKSARPDGPTLTLGLGRGGSAIGAGALELAQQTKTPVTGTVSAAVKGGFSVDVGGTRAFCPISQIDTTYVTEAEGYVGQTLEFIVTEFREAGRNVVLSRKALLLEQQRTMAEEMLTQIAVGATVTGKVKAVVKHGAVIDIGGLEGFVHVSELAHGRVARPEDVVQPGESVTAKVLSVERTDRGTTIKLSLKANEEAPKRPEVQLEEILDGKVVRHIESGLIVSTSKGEGLVPNRELELAPGADPRRTYPLGHDLRVVVVAKDGQSGKLRFSVTQVARVEERKNYAAFASATKTENASMGTLGALLAEKLGQSKTKKK